MPIRTFLDSGVLIAAFKGDTEAAKKAYEIICDPNREFFTSDLVGLEVYPKAIFHKNKLEEQFYDAYFAGIKNIQLTTPEHIEKSLDLGKIHGIRGFDAALAQSAIELKADEFVTSEKDTKPLFRLKPGKLQVISIASGKQKTKFAKTLGFITSWIRRG